MVLRADSFRFLHKRANGTINAKALSIRRIFLFSSITARQTISRAPTPPPSLGRCLLRVDQTPPQPYAIKKAPRGVLFFCALVRFASAVLARARRRSRREPSVTLPSRVAAAMREPCLLLFPKAGICSRGSPHPSRSATPSPLGKAKVSVTLAGSRRNARADAAATLSILSHRMAVPWCRRQARAVPRLCVILSEQSESKPAGRPHRGRI